MVRLWQHLTLLVLLSATTSGCAAQSRQRVQRGQRHLICSFHVDGGGDLHVTFCSGKNLAVPKENGRFDVAQEGFVDIHLAKDKLRIGWLAAYKVCAQSYACTPEVQLLDGKNHTVYISPSVGIISGWTFVKGGNEVAIRYGFPHGDTLDAYALYDAASGKKLADFSATEKKSAPDWVRELVRLTPHM